MNPNQTQDIQKLPLLPLRGLVVFPGSVITLDAGRERSIAAIEEAMGADRRLLRRARGAGQRQGDDDGAHGL